MVLPGIDISFHRRVRGEGAETAVGEGQGHVRSIEGERVGHYFQHEKTDAGGEVMCEVACWDTMERACVALKIG
jgi:hypothetical protein